MSGKDLHSCVGCKCCLNCVFKHLDKGIYEGQGFNTITISASIHFVDQIIADVILGERPISPLFILKSEEISLSPDPLSQVNL